MKCSYRFFIIYAIIMLTLLFGGLTSMLIAPTFMPGWHIFFIGCAMIIPFLLLDAKTKAE